jgi:zinc transport system substrate-binding protein
MKLKNIIIALAVLAVLIVVIVATGNSNNTASGQDTVQKVGATIFPIYDLAKNIAGDEFEVVLLLPAGASPHTFDPRPSLLKDLQGAQTVFAVGNGLDTWSDIVTESLDIPVVTVDHDVVLRATVEAGYDDHDEHEEDHVEESHDDHEEDEHEDDHSGHSHGPIDPHYWLSIHNAEQIVMNIAEELSALDTENESLYMERAQNYAEQLEQLDEELQAQVVGITDRNIISLHDAWYYFADEFGLTIVGTFEPSAGKEPTPQYLAHLEEEVEENNVTVLFMEPQLSTRSIQSFANDHSLSIAILDPLGGADGRNSYINLMRYNVAQVVDALVK